MKSINQEFKAVYELPLLNNLEEYELRLKQKRYSDEPTQKLDNVKTILDDNNIKRKLHSEPEKTVDQLKEVAKKSIDLIRSKPLDQINIILEQLMDIETDFLKEHEVEEFEKVLTDINKLSYQIKKKL